MDSESRRDLLLGAAVALGTTLLLRQDLGAAALFVAVSTLLATCGRGFSFGLVALPVLLASLPDRESLADSPPPGPVRVDGRVASIRLDLLLGEQDLLVRTPGGLLTMTCPTDLSVLPGDRLRAVARCSRPAIVHHRASLRAETGACIVEPGPFSVPRACAAMRRSLEHALLRLVEARHGPLLCTLVLGQGTRLPEELAAAHRATGLSHLLAVSGAHAAMLAWLLGLQPFFGGRRRPVGRLHLWVAMSCLLLYGAITGMEPPVFRALFGYLLVAIGLRLGRRVAAIQALVWPALVSTIAAPDGVLGPSFCLSYAAVFGLSIAGPPRGDSRVERFVRAPIRASFWATMTTAPLTLLFFGQLAPWTIVLTPLLAPFIGGMLCLALIGAVLMQFGLPVEEVLATPLTALADGYAAALTFADCLPGTPVHAFCTPGTALLLAAAATGVCAAVWIETRRGLFVALAVASAPHFLPPPPAQAEVYVFAVGHGQACLLQLDDGESVLIDCGSQQHPSLPARKVERALRARCVDWLVVTHSDHDHTSAIEDLLRRVPVRSAILPASMRDSAVAASLRASGSTLLYLAPGEHVLPHPKVSVAAPRPDSETDNDRSLWVRAEVSGWTLLASGDAEEAGVAAALREGIAGHADVLVLPHHGRENSAAAALLRAVGPRLCLASNQHGDGASALGRLALSNGIETFATAISGDLLVTGKGDPKATAVPEVAPLRR